MTFCEVHRARAFIDYLMDRAKQGGKRRSVHFVSIEDVMICATSEDSSSH